MASFPTRFMIVMALASTILAIPHPPSSPDITAAISLNPSNYHYPSQDIAKNYHQIPPRTQQSEIVAFLDTDNNDETEAPSKTKEEEGSADVTSSTPSAVESSTLAAVVRPKRSADDTSMPYSSGRARTYPRRR